jgi:hypothetical protein
MAKRIQLKVGDIFSLEVAKNEYIFGRVLFDVTKQYIESPYYKGGKNFFSSENSLDFFNGCLLLETFCGIYSTVDKIDINKKAVVSAFVSKDFYKASFYKERNFQVIGYQKVDYKQVSFPEALESYNNKFYFSCGELYLPINIDGQQYDEIKVHPSFGYGYYEIIVATLDFSGRDDLIEPDDKLQNYFRWSDLRSLPAVRNEIYKLLNETTKQNYYELALKYGYDLKRLYEK